MIEKLKKIKELAINGVGGEKLAAQKKLNELCKKFSVNINFLNEEKRTSYLFEFKTEFEKRLLHQINVKVRNLFGTGYFNVRGKKNKIGFDFTRFEFLEFNYLLEVYKRALEEQLLICFEAFIQKNNIFPITDEDRKKRYTDKEKEMNSKILKAMSVQKEIIVNKAIEQRGTE